jgi:ABC-2 type transport system ATP-binding protein
MPPDAAAPAVALRGLVKRYGPTVAVDRLDLDVPRGSFFGLLGPNGAGKSTTLKMVTGLLRPDYGTAYVEGVDVWREPLAVKQRIGVLPENAPLFDRLTGRELLRYTGLLRGMDKDQVDQRSYDLVNVLGLLPYAGKLVVDFSFGMRKKIALACALLHAPRVLFLDEPLEGVDPSSSGTIREVLERFTADGGTVVFSSHVMEVVEKLCDRVAILHHGHVVVTGTLDEVCQGATLEDVFVSIAGRRVFTDQDLSWLGS